MPPKERRRNKTAECAVVWNSTVVLVVRSAQKIGEKVVDALMWGRSFSIFYFQNRQQIVRARSDTALRACLPVCTAHWLRTDRKNCSWKKGNSFIYLSLAHNRCQRFTERNFSAPRTTTSSCVVEPVVEPKTHTFTAKQRTLKINEPANPHSGYLHTYQLLETLRTSDLLLPFFFSFQPQRRMGGVRARTSETLAVHAAY